MAGFQNSAAARAFYATLGEEKPGQRYTVTPLDIETLERMFDIFADIKVNWDRLADRSGINDAEATKLIFQDLAAFEEELKSDLGPADVPMTSDGYLATA